MSGKKTNFVETLRGVRPSQGADLRNVGIHTVEGLRERIARDGFAKTLEGRAVPADRLRRALSRYELEAADGRTDSRARRAWRRARENWAEAILALLVLLVVGLGVRAVLRPEREVYATRELTPFEVIGPDYIRTRPAHADFGVANDSAKVVGLFPLRTISEGKALRSDQLGHVRFKPASVLQDRRIVTVAVAKRTLPLAVPGTHAVLLLSPREAGVDSAAVIDDVIVMSAGEAGDSASVVLAVRTKDLHDLARSLGASEAFLAQAVAPAAPDTATRH